METRRPSSWLDLLGRAHQRLVFSRRAEVLAGALASWVPRGATLLDVGCGDGSIAARVGALSGASVRGFDVLLRPRSHIPVQVFDGTKLPVADRSSDVVLLVDVLHHTADPMVLLREARRVAARSVLLKDHRLSRPAARAVLRFMDWVGNRAHGVQLPYNYWPEARWRDAFREVGLEVRRWRTELGLYPWPLSLAFESGLHFLAELSPMNAES